MENCKGADHITAANIQEKLGDSSGVSYSEIANRAIERGKVNLAIMVSVGYVTYIYIMYKRILQNLPNKNATAETAVSI